MPRYDIPRVLAEAARLCLTHADLAAKAGLNAATIGRLAAGRHQARPSTVRRLARAVGLRPEELVLAPVQPPSAPPLDDLALE